MSLEVGRGIKSVCPGSLLRAEAYILSGLHFAPLLFPPRHVVFGNEIPSQVGFVSRPLRNAAFPDPLIFAG
jgi:hypothetical protein